MTRNGLVVVLALLILPGRMKAAEHPVSLRGGIEGREFSEPGRLYVDDDDSIHFRTDQRLYYFSHMYYIWDTLEAAGVVKDGKITYDKPLRITGNYSKAKYVYNFLEEPALRGSQIMWIDQIEKVELPAGQQYEFTSLFNGESLAGWSIIAAAAGSDPVAWKVKDRVICGSAPPIDSTQTLISDASFADFELSFEYRAAWHTSASLLLRANGDGAGIAIGLDHVDKGTIGFPKSAAGATRPFMLFENRQAVGVGVDAHFHVQYEGRRNQSAVARDEPMQCCTLDEFLNAWDGGCWNMVRIRCVGAEPEITVWINGCQISNFNADTASMDDQVPAGVGAIENYTVDAAGRIGFALHSADPEKSELRLREIRVRKL